MSERIQSTPVISIATICFCLLSAFRVGAETGNQPPSAPAEHTFDRQWLIDKARNLAEREYEATSVPDESPLRELSYDQYRAIEFRRDASIWAQQNLPFRLGLLHLGFLFHTPVSLNVVENGVPKTVPYSDEFFNYGLDTGFLKEHEAPGYSGFRVNHPINRPGVWDEFLVFQGGSYFRALGKHNWYGLSARGLAINTAKPSGEEFPAFTEFWIERPQRSTDRIVIHALLDSASLTGAYTFSARPGDHTAIDVEATLFPRRELKAFGIAPLTSMFMFDGSNRSRFDDFRPAVHDSDGLALLLSNGERVWRPLANPRTLQVSAFNSEALQGFGLLQRKRDFEDFEDIEARYERRPSVWIEPLDGWGKGHVELVEIPSKQETNDNIVAFWQPAEALKAQSEHTFSYRMHWGAELAPSQRAGRIVSTRSGLAVLADTTREFFVDFAADHIPEDLDIDLTTSAGEIVDVRGRLVDATGHYRVSFKFEPQDEELAEFRLALSQDGERWGETWLYRWTE